MSQVPQSQILQTIQQKNTPKNNQQQKKIKIKLLDEQSQQTTESLKNIHDHQQQHKQQAGINFIQQYTQSNHYLSANPSTNSYENLGSPNNRNSGILGHRNSNASISQNSYQQQSTLNSSSINRKQKQSPNIARANKLFPDDFFQGSQIDIIGSPTSQINSQQTRKNGAYSEKHQFSQEHITQEEEQISSQNMLKQSNIANQKQSDNKKNVKTSKNAPKRFMFPDDDESSGQNQIVHKQLKVKALNIKEDEYQLQQHQIFMSPKQRKLKNKGSQNQDNQNYKSNQNDNEPFDGLKTQYVHISLDSDKIKRIQGVVKQFKKNQAQNQSNSENRYKGRNLDGSPQPSIKGSKVNSKDVQNQKYVIKEEKLDKSSSIYQNQSERSKGLILPDLKSSSTRNQQYIQDTYWENSIGQVPNLNETQIVNLSLSRQKNQKLSNCLRTSFKRDDLENHQTAQIENDDSNQNLSKNNITYLESSYMIQCNESKIQRLNESNFFNAGSPQTSRIHDYSQLNLNSNGKNSNNTSALLQPNYNHHQWNRSPQLDTQKPFNNNPLYFPQSTRNLQNSTSPTNSNILTSKILNKPVKFPNIFNHNNQANQPMTLSYLNYQSSPQTFDTNISARFSAVNQNQQFNFSKKGKIAVDHNYQVVKNMQFDNNQISRNNVIQERKDENSESDNSLQRSLSSLNQKETLNVKKIKLDRKMLTSRDQDQRWIEQAPERKSMGRVKSKSKLEKSNKGDMLIQEIKESIKTQQTKKNSPFSQSSLCWYNSPRNHNQDVGATFGPSPDYRESRNARKKEDQPRYSLPENKFHLFEEKETQQKSIQRYSSKLTEFKSTKMSMQEIETPNFKQELALGKRNSLTFKKKRESLIEQTFNSRYNQLQNPHENRINGKNALAQESLPFQYKPNSHDIFDEDKFNCSSHILNEEYTSLPVSRNEQDMRDSLMNDDRQLLIESKHANYHKCDQQAEQLQNQQVQLASQKGNVEVRGRSLEARVEGEIKKFKVITKSKKREQEFTIENKAKLIKQLEKNLKKSKNNDIQFSNTIQMEQQEQTQCQVITQSHSNPNLQIKEGNSSNIANINNSNIQKKVPIIKKSQIQNQQKSSETSQKVNIVKNAKKINSNNLIQVQSIETQNQLTLNTQNQLTNNYLDQNQQNMKSVNFNNCNQKNAQNIHQQVAQQQIQSSQDYYKTSHFLESSQQVVPQQGKVQRRPLQSLQNNQTNHDSQFNETYQTKSYYQQEQTPFFPNKQPVTHHINQIYMAAQIPQEFNGMITFMNIQQQISDHHSQSQDSQHAESDPFKQTNGSLMRGTILSVTHGNQVFNQTINNNQLGSTTGQASQGSCNNSIIMLQSENNYMTSNFGGQLLTSPLNTQHLFIMQQHINMDQNHNTINHSNNKQTDYYNNNSNGKIEKGHHKKNQKSSFSRSSSNANKENQYFNNQQNEQELNYKVEFQNSKHLKANEVINHIQTVNNDTKYKQTSITKKKQVC